MSILVLSPDPEAASALCSALSRAGYESIWERSAVAAAGLLTERTPAVLVLDTSIEGHASIIADLRGQAPWARVVLIGEPSPAGGADLPWFPKPFDASVLTSLLAREREIALVLQSRFVLHRQVEHAERLASIGRVSAGMAHEINNPLAVIRASAAYVAMAAARSNDGELATCAEDIEVAVARIGTFVEHLSGFASQERPRIVHAPVRPALEIALRMLRSYANESNVRVTLRSDPILCVPHDAPRLAQAVLNLLFHAVRRASQGGATVELGARGGPTDIYIEVDDDGPRPTQKAAAQAFDLFANETSNGGSGLGLSITRRIAHDHGGCVWLEPRDPAGARAVLALPRFNPSVYTLLVVDGDPELRRGLASELRRESFDVIAAASFAEARPILREREVHLVLADATLADLDGPLPARLARERARSRSLVLYGDPGSVGPESGPALKRPYDHAELMRVVRELCEAPSFDEP